MVPPEKVHQSLFVGCQRKFAKPKHPAVARYNQKRTAEQVDKMTQRLLRKERKLRKRLAAHGIDYDFPGFVGLVHLVLDPPCPDGAFGKYLRPFCSSRLHRRLRRKRPPALWMHPRVVK